MGHRHIFNTGQIFDPNDEQSWKHLHPEQPYGHFARAAPAENSSIVYPIDNMSIDAIPYGGSHWNSTPMSNGFPTSNPCVEMPHHQPDASGPSHDPFMHPSSVGNFSMTSESYPPQASSSNYGAQTFNRIEEGLVDLTSNGRGPYKRKSPGVPLVCERGSSSRCYDGTTPPDLSMPSDMWQEKQNVDCHQTPWDTSAINSSYIGNNLPVGNEGSLRNVRSRALFEADTTLPRTNLSAAPSHQTYMAPNPGDRSCPMDYMGQNSDAQMREWGHFHASHSAHGRNPMPDPSPFNHETNKFIIGGNNPGAPLEIGPYHNNFIASRTHGPQNLQGAPGQSTRGSRSGYTQRSNPTFRGPSSSNVHWGHSETTHGGMLIGGESYPSRNSRPLSTIGWRSNDRSGRTRVSNDRFRSFSDEAGLRSRMTSEGLMIVDRSGMYGSRSAFDQHSDMRLDVDNMSYEELLALGERIGNVSTGLSEDLVSKCLTESVYCSSDQVQDEERCVICLDEYKNMDDVGMLRKCGHDFHVGCIKQWLFMKNLCPICKASAAAD